MKSEFLITNKQEQKIFADSNIKSMFSQNRITALRTTQLISGLEQLQIAKFLAYIFMEHKFHLPHSLLYGQNIAGAVNILLKAYYCVK